MARRKNSNPKLSSRKPTKGQLRKIMKSAGEASRRGKSRSTALRGAWKQFRQGNL